MTLQDAVAKALSDRNIKVDDFEHFGVHSQKIAGEVVGLNARYRFVLDMQASTLIVEPQGKERFDQYLVDRECRKGYSCGGSCITRSKACLKNLSAEQVKLVNDLKGMARVSLSQQLQAENAAAAAGGTVESVESVESVETPAVPSVLSTEEPTVLQPSEPDAPEFVDFEGTILDIPSAPSSLQERMFETQLKLEDMPPAQAQRILDEHMGEDLVFVSPLDVTQSERDKFVASELEALQLVMGRLTTGELKERARLLYSLDEDQIRQFGSLNRKATYFAAIANRGGDQARISQVIANRANQEATRELEKRLDSLNRAIAGEGQLGNIREANPNTSITAVRDREGFDGYLYSTYTTDDGEEFTARSPNRTAQIATAETFNTDEFPLANNTVLFDEDNPVTQTLLKDYALSYGTDINNSLVLQYDANTNEDSDFASTDRVVSGMRDLAAANLDEGGVVLMPAQTDRQKDIATALGLQNNLQNIEPFDDDRQPNLYVGIYKDGRIQPIDNPDQRVEDMLAVRQGRTRQMEEGAERLGTPDIVRSFLGPGLTEEQELAQMRTYREAEDRLLGRSPTGTVPSKEVWEQRADEWSRSIFGDFDEGANGFSLAQTKAHDVAHPITHEMLGTNTARIHRDFGGFLDAQGRDSLIAEEAIVNMVEHFSRGDSQEASLLNGVRLARVLARSSNTSDEERAYYRSPEFKTQLQRIGNQIYRNNDFADYMEIVMSANRVSGTVTAAGDNFNDTASGG